MKLKSLFVKWVIQPIKDALHKTKELGWFFGILAYLLSQVLLWSPAIAGLIIGFFFKNPWGYGLASGYAIWVFAPTGTTFFYIPLLFASIAIMRWIKKRLGLIKNVQKTQVNNNK